MSIKKKRFEAALNDKFRENLVFLAWNLYAVALEGMPIVVQNSGFQRTVLLNEFGYDLAMLWDTKMMASHVDESMSAGLKDMSKQWLNYDQAHYKVVSWN